MMKTIDDWCVEISFWRQKQGFVTPEKLEEGDGALMLAKLMLIVSECAEAAEAVRDYDLDNFKEELADACIRIFDIAGTMDFSLEHEIDQKMIKNRTRAYQHARKSSA